MKKENLQNSAETNENENLSTEGLKTQSNEFKKGDFEELSSDFGDGEEEDEDVNGDDDSDGYDGYDYGAEDDGGEDDGTQDDGTEDNGDEDDGEEEDDAPDYSSTDDTLSSELDVTVVGVITDSDGYTFLILSDGSLYDPRGATVTDSIIQSVAIANPQIFPPNGPLPPADDFTDLEDFLGYVDQQQPKPQPCTPAAQQAGTTATNKFANSSVQAQVNSGNLFPANSTNEHGFSIRQSANDGSIYTSEIKDLGGTNGGGVTNYQNTIADLHTHPNDNYGPSARDIISLASRSSGYSPNLTTSYVITQNGTKYALEITSASAATAFNTGYSSFVSGGNNWQQGSVIGDKYNDAVNYFRNIGVYNREEIYERAIALTLEGSGIVLLKAAPGSNNFTKIGTVQVKNDDGTPLKDANGNNVYKTADCPH